MRSKIRELQVLDNEFVSPEEHEGLHNKDRYVEIVRAHGKVVKIDEWRTFSKIHKISSTAIIRSGNVVLRTEKSVYDYVTGLDVIATVTGTLVRINGKVISIIYERDNDMEGI